MPLPYLSITVRLGYLILCTLKQFLNALTNHLLISFTTATVLSFKHSGSNPCIFHCRIIIFFSDDSDLSLRFSLLSAKHQILIVYSQLLAAWPRGSERRFYDGHDRKVDGLTLTEALLLRPWIRCFMTIISAWWNLTSSKLKKSKAKLKRKTRATPKRVWIRPMHSVSAASRDRRIKMKKSSQSCLA